LVYSAPLQLSQDSDVYDIFVVISKDPPITSCLLFSDHHIICFSPLHVEGMVSDSRRRRSGWKSQREQGEKEREGEKRVKERGRGRVCDRDASLVGNLRERERER